MGWIDIVIAVLVIAAAIHGLRLGAVVQLGSFLGFWLGLAFGAGIALVLAKPLASGTWRTVLTVAFVLGAAVAAGTLGRVLGGWIAVTLKRWHLGSFDAAAGAAFGALSVLISAWLIAGFLLQSGVPWLTSAVDRSAILRTVDSALPPVPAALAEVQGLLSTTGFPSVFAGAVPVPSSTVPPPTSSVANAIAAPALGSVFKVFGAACGGYQEGTGFMIAPHLLVTNAHVVAGMAHPTAIVANQAIALTPVLVDPKLDLAVLRTPTTLGPPLALDTAAQAAGTPAAFVGFPGNGPEVVGAAGIAQSFEAIGRDIYSSSLTTRQVDELTGVIRPGSSGSPLLVNGGVAGVVFSRSTVNPKVGYALSAAAVAPDLAAAQHRSLAVATGACVPH